ncbi:MAG: Sec-independent protein translocase protein TatB [Gammaproteobacteria bacterium]|nr:Sec-independent protein translocase protein TatB [Gammaproteobacteria bacterium]
MFEIGFGELMLVFVVALLVFGPNKIPGLVRDIGFWVGRFRGFVSGVRSEVETELRKHDEWKRLIEEQAEIVKRNVVDAIEPPATQVSEASTDALPPPKPAAPVPIASPVAVTHASNEAQPPPVKTHDQT